MPEVIEISSGRITAALAPALGGAVLSLSCSGRDILRRAASPQAVAADPREAACYPIVPWFSRLKGGLDFAGRHFDLAPTLPVCDPDHALHGHGWVTPWSVTDCAQDSLSSMFEHAPAPGRFPFRFRAMQRCSVSQDCFRIDLSLLNTGREPMPAGLGLHPFFPHGAGATIEFNGGHIALAESPRDDSYPAWGGSARLAVTGAALELASDAPILHLYAPKDEPFFCAEPVTHLPGRFGENVLQPGEMQKIFLKISVILSRP